MRLYCTLASLALLMSSLGCERGEARERGASEGEPPAATTKKDAGEPNAPIAELLDDGFYRAPGGHALLRWSSLDAKQWTVEKGKNMKHGGIQVFGPGLAVQVEVFRDPPPAEALLEQAAKGAGVPFDSSAIEGFPHPGGSASLLRAPKMHFIVVADGSSAVRMLLVSAQLPAARLSADAAKGKPALELAAELIDGLRVGTKVPQLPPANPGESLAGVWVRLGDEIGSYSAYMFDPRGYYLNSLGGDSGTIDPLTWYQREDARVGTYQLSGDSLRLIPRDGKARELTIKSRSDEQLEFSNNRQSYDRLDGHAKPGVKLEGLYERDVFRSNNDGFDTFTFRSSSWYRFSKDGTFSTDGFVASSLSESPGAAGGHNGPSDSSGRRVTGVDVSREKGSSSGRYEVVEDAIVLHYEGGGSKRMSLFPLLDAKGEWWMIYLGGRQMSRD